MKGIIVLLAFGLFILLAEVFRLKKAVKPLAIIGLLAAIATAVLYWWFDDGILAPYFGGMVEAIDVNGKLVSTHKIPSYVALTAENSTVQYFSMLEFGESAIIFSVIILVTALLWFIMAGEFFAEPDSRTDHASLIYFSVIGAIMLTCYNNMTMLFLGIEILSIPLYVLAGSKKDDLASNEASLKYFLMGAFASAFLLFGIALLYGATGTFDIRQMGGHIAANGGTPVLYSGIILLLVGLLFKISAAPFHFWAPDVYQGAPTPVTAFMATIVKTAAIVAIMRLFLSPYALGPASEFWMPIMAVVVGLTLVIGNVTAVVQTQVKRLLAFSSISHAGFLLLAITAFVGYGAKAIIFYTAAYSIASIVAFTVLLNVIRQTGGDSIDNFNGLAKRNPLLAVAMTIALLSLAGIPPTAGFFGKYYILSAALDKGLHWLVILAIVTSLIGVYYYFRIIIAMFLKPASGEAALTATNQHQALLFVTAVATLVLGLLPDLLLEIGTIAPPTP